jgi:hypothetical protein
MISKQYYHIFQNFYTLILAMAQTQYEYYDQTYNYDLDSYESTSFGNESDYYEAAPVVVVEEIATPEETAPQQKKNKNKEKTTYNAGTDASYAAASTYDAGATTGGSTYGATGGYDAPKGLSCWKCHADSFELCQSSGYLQTCQSNEVIWKFGCLLEFKDKETYCFFRKTFFNQIFNFKQLLLF